MAAVARAKVALDPLAVRMLTRVVDGLHAGPAGAQRKQSYAEYAAGVDPRQFAQADAAVAATVVDDAEAFEASEHLLPGDFTFFRADGCPHVRTRMRKRKDMKVLRGKQASVVAGGGGSYFDAAELVAEWLRVRRQAGIDEACAMFCFPDGTPIRTRDVRIAVRCAMAAAGLDPIRFGAHSLRIGGATAALAAGVSPQLIRLMGRWSSDIYEIYCRMSLQAALGVGRSIASQRVDSFESGFRTESLEMLPHEVDLIRAEEAELR